MKTKTKHTANSLNIHQLQSVQLLYAFIYPPILLRNRFLQVSFDKGGDNI